MDDAKLIEEMARAITPYAWNNSYWQEITRSGSRAAQFPRNQIHAQENARRAAIAALRVVKASAAL